MKTKFIQAGYAILLPIIFIGILALLTVMPFNNVSKYGFGGILVTGIALLLTYIAVKREKTSFRAIQFYMDSKTPIRFLYGVIVGTLIVVAMIFVIVNFSKIEIIYKDNSIITSVLIGLLPLLPLAYMEEVVFRGYAFTKVTKHLGIWPAQIILALLFTWYHDFTGATFLNQLIGPGVWALIFGLVTLRSKGIAFATGLHMALNAVQALVGLKEHRDAIWSLEYSQTMTPELQSQTETIGLILQLIILVVGVYLTERYRRITKKNS